MLKDVRYIIGVAAGKGGVGKSSMAVNLALTWKKLGYQVGIFDADIYGPSLGMMMPLDIPLQIQKEFIEPGIFQGVQAMSLAYLKPNKEAVMARAPVANGLIAQCIEQVNWKDLDYLIVDFPPGTGDIQLTLMQMLPLSGVVLVTTPQEVAGLDVQKAAQMFLHMGVSLLGVIENMSYFLDPVTSVRHFVFGEGGGEKIARQFGIPFLGQVPIDSNLSRCGDLGIAFPLDFSDSLTAHSFQKIATCLSENLFILEEAKKVCLQQFEYAWKEMD
jgi:ATP-binding protein involved in chromosome partitioning